MSVKIKVENLTKVFGKKVKQALELSNQNKEKDEIVRKTKATVAVNNVNFSINEGEIFVIMGLSGSGKSTLVRLLNRLIEPTAGSIYLDNMDVSKLSKNDLREVRRTKMSMVFQGFALFPHRTVLQNTEYGLEVRGVAPDERTKIAENALDRSGLLAYKNQYPHQLSGGMQQRVGLARALANDPEILLMDESFSALDPLIRGDMQDELMDLQEQMKKTIIFITHDLNEALKIGDRIAIMKDGKVVQIGTGEEILTNPANEYVRRFVEGVDRTKILNVEHIMSKPRAIINVDKAGLHLAMNRMVTSDFPFLILTNSHHEFLGYITDRDTALAIKKKGANANYKDIVKTDMHIVALDTPIPKIYRYLLSKGNLPVVVMDNNAIRGVIMRRNVIELLSSVAQEEISEVV
ncbi:quaternary amine ABC transporter ATP-binding protein [Pectinatus brassicae]|uniref:Quaternary amine transport ATP-binding protein n=1 Tax=Pectinatus brassicae TaxID=862415 RepID=A0A840UVZ6_9FIRM|nr:glycine betaine/L-proline ABC transporter ATP-binding protein [Pectinatus brassicae]MBB5336605.1 glycine betaine/proline transport system ATP-binding protein [Pectinatus brassicae]